MLGNSGLGSGLKQTIGAVGAKAKEGSGDQSDDELPSRGPTHPRKLAFGCVRSRPLPTELLVLQVTGI